MAAKVKAMDPVDAAWYHMDGATNLAMVTGVSLTSEPLDFERVKAVYTHRLLPLERFRQRVVETGMPYPTPHWEEDPYFNIDDHFHHVALPEPRDKQALLEAPTLETRRETIVTLIEFALRSGGEEEILQ